MATEPDWKGALSSLARYENIQTIKAALEAAGPRTAVAQTDAFNIENEAYKTSTSLEEYHATCQVHLRPDAGDQPSTESAPAGPRDAEPPGNVQAPEVRIGSYQSCRFVASGVTAEVYSSGGRALKVITETRNIEPHNPAREARILAELKRPCIPLLETFRDQEQRFVLVFPYMPLSLEMLLARGPITPKQARNHFMDLLTALQHIHSKGIIHRDVKPSALLLESPDGPAVLSDFGAAWHPQMSLDSEPEDQKVLDIGTGPYRAPEVLFGNRSYGPAVDMWGTGAMLAESCRNPPRPLFESRPVHEDGNQLGLILSIFRTMGSPTPESWPEAASFRTPPFEMYRAFEHRAWEDILPDVEPELRALIARLVVYNSTRASATEALGHLSSLQVDP